ncbi:cystin-1 [Tachyglossus aculeatus]|uniref:cystin-1 n=1 Tax=Tachyglossus aculeatus TaxID=9261 RepID=UPI0018F6803C|nr:cystin-1 [Tachyglossus aculeatus]
MPRPGAGGPWRAVPSRGRVGRAGRVWAAAAAKAGAAVGVRGSAGTRPREGDEELLDKVLAEAEAAALLGWGGPDPPKPDPRPRGTPRPRRRPSQAAQEPGVSSAGSTQDIENNNISENPSLDSKRPESQAPVLYDYSEEELMASIEKEYSR